MLSTVLSLISLVLACTSLFFALGALKRSERSVIRTLAQGITALEIEQAAQSDQLATWAKAVKRMNARDRQQKHRANGPAQDGDAPDPDADPEGWKRHQMTLHPKGVFS